MIKPIIDPNFNVKEAQKKISSLEKQSMNLKRSLSVLNMNYDKKLISSVIKKQSQMKVSNIYIEKEKNILDEPFYIQSSRRSVIKHRVLSNKTLRSDCITPERSSLNSSLRSSPILKKSKKRVSPSKIKLNSITSNSQGNINEMLKRYNSILIEEDNEKEKLRAEQCRYSKFSNLNFPRTDLTMIEPRIQLKKSRPKEKNFTLAYLNSLKQVIEKTNEVVDLKKNKLDKSGQDKLNEFISIVNNQLPFVEFKSKLALINHIKLVDLDSTKLCLLEISKSLKEKELEKGHKKSSSFNTSFLGLASNPNFVGTRKNSDGRHISKFSSIYDKASNTNDESVKISMPLPKKARLVKIEVPKYGRVTQSKKEAEQQEYFAKSHENELIDDENVEEQHHPIIARLLQLVSELKSVDLGRKEMYFDHIKNVLNRTRDNYQIFVNKRRTELMTLITGKIDETQINNENVKFNLSKDVEVVSQMPSTTKKRVERGSEKKDSTFSKVRVQSLKPNRASIFDSNDRQAFLQNLRVELKENEKDSKENEDYFEYIKRQRETNYSRIELDKVIAKFKEVSKGINELKQSTFRDASVSIRDYQNKLFEIGKATLNKNGQQIIQNHFIDILENRQIKTHKMKSRWEILADSIRSYAPKDITDFFYKYAENEKEYIRLKANRNEACKSEIKIRDGSK